MSKKFNPIIETEDDQLFIPEVGSWSTMKYTYFGYYCDIFTNSMKDKWDNLIYVDLFAGSGFSRLKDTGKIIYASPLIAMSIPNLFSKYILCEAEENRFKALESRVNRLFPDKNVELFSGNSNANIKTIISKIPKFSKENTGLSFAFVDPYSLNLHFNTIKELSKLRMDFLILLAFHMDANRNFKIYYEQENHKIEQFLDKNNWRDSIKDSFIDDPSNFVSFLGQSYREKMNELGYISTDTFVKIKSDKKNLPLYYLAFFSRNKLGSKFWSEVKKYANPQIELF